MYFRHCQRKSSLASDIIPLRSTILEIYQNGGMRAFREDTRSFNRHVLRSCRCFNSGERNVNTVPEFFSFNKKMMHEFSARLRSYRRRATPGSTARPTRWKQSKRFNFGRRCNITVTGEMESQPPSSGPARSDETGDDGPPSNCSPMATHTRASHALHMNPKLALGRASGIADLLPRGVT